LKILSFAGHTNSAGPSGALMRIFVLPYSGDLFERADEVVRHAVAVLHSSQIVSAREGGILNGRAVVLIDAEEVPEALVTLEQAGWRAAVN
jgi:hypothetical protein